MMATARTHAWRRASAAPHPMGQQRHWPDHDARWRRRVAAAVLASRERAMRAEMRGGPGYSIFSDVLGRQKTRWFWRITLD